MGSPIDVMTGSEGQAIAAYTDGEAVQRHGAPATPPVVLQVLPRLESGGVERGTIDIARAVTEAGGVALVASEGGRMRHELDRIGARHLTLPLAGKSPLTLRRNVSRLRAVIRQYGVHLVHARSRAPAWSALAAARAEGLPFVTTFHGTYSGAGNWLKNRYNAVMTRGDRVIAISQFIAEHITRHYPVAPERLTVIPRGINLDHFDPEKVTAERVIRLSRQWRLSGEEQVVMLPGRLSRWKGQPVLIDAVPRVLEQLGHRRLRVLLVGDDQGRGGYRRELEARVDRLGLADVIHVVDHCDDMPAAYMLTDAVVSASTDPEAFGRVPVEGQAMGRPVIATAHGGATETVLPGETGWLVTPGRSAPLAEAICQVLRLSDTRRQQVAAKGIAHVRENFSLAQMCEKTLEVYESLLGGGS